MSRTVRHAAGVLLVAAGLLASAVLVLAQPQGASAAASTGRVRGYVVAPHGVTPPLKVSWFTTDWKYIGSRSVSGNGSYGLSLPAGSYRIQFADKRPSYDVTKLAVTDATVVVRAAHTTVKNVHMHRGSAITGTVHTGGKAGSHATVVAANKAKQSFSTIANAQGQFAIGGLPKGSYSVFTYDHQKTYVGKSSFVSGLKPGKPQNLGIHLNKKAGGLLVDLYAGKQPVRGTVAVTAVSKKTGQFWTTKAHHGTAVFRGVYPGKYQLVAPGAGDYLGKTGTVKNGVVRAGRTAFGSFRLTEHGGVFVGRLVSSNTAHTPVAKATVRLYDPSGSIVAVATTAADGSFRIGGRLGTMPSVSLVAFDGAHMAAFDVLRVRGLSIKVNQTKSLGDLELPAKASASPTATVTPSVTPTVTPTATPTSTPTTSPSSSPSTTSPATSSPTATATH